MKALLTLATLLTIANPSIAGLADDYQQNQDTQAAKKAQCKMLFNKGQFVENIVNAGLAHHYHIDSVNRVTVADQFGWCSFVGYVGTEYKEVEFAIEGDKLIRYSINRNPRLVRHILTRKHVANQR